jgi:large subunit ribosomal protein L24e
MAGRTCNFCGSQIEPGTGTVYIRKDGMPINLCSRKCRINMLQLKRVPRKTKWTNEYHSIKEMRKQSSSKS